MLGLKFVMLHHQSIF